MVPEARPTAHVVSQCRAAKRALLPQINFAGFSLDTKQYMAVREFVTPRLSSFTREV
jgi:hypothetical protein